MRYLKIANHERYFITDTGKVISSLNNNELTPRTNANGYLIVTLDSIQLSVHRLVAKHFIPNPYAHPQVNHINGNKADNRAENLEWVSAMENAQHALKNNLRRGYIPYSEKVFLMMRAISGELIANLCKEVSTYSVHPNTLSKMLRQTAVKENLEHEWKEAMKIRRKESAIRNLKKANAK